MRVAPAHPSARDILKQQQPIEAYSSRLNCTADRLCALAAKADQRDQRLSPDCAKEGRTVSQNQEDTRCDQVQSSMQSVSLHVMCY